MMNWLAKSSALIEIIEIESLESESRRYAQLDYLQALLTTQPNVKLLSHLKPYVACSAYEQMMKASEEITFPAIFNSPLGHYLFMQYLTNDEAFHDAMFLADANYFRGINQEDSRLRLAIALYQRFVSPSELDQEHWDRQQQVHVEHIKKNENRTLTIKQQESLSTIVVAATGEFTLKTLAQPTAPSVMVQQHQQITQPARMVWRRNIPLHPMRVVPKPVRPNPTSSPSLRPSSAEMMKQSNKIQSTQNHISKPINNQSVNRLNHQSIHQSINQSIETRQLEFSISLNTTARPPQRGQNRVHPAPSIQTTRRSARSRLSIHKLPSSSSNLSTSQSVSGPLRSHHVHNTSESIAEEEEEDLRPSGDLSNNQSINQSTNPSEVAPDFLGFGNVDNKIGIYGRDIVKVREEIASGKVSIRCFDDLTAQVVMRLATESFPRFLQSTLYQRYIQLTMFASEKVKVEHFERLQLIGRGGFGKVYAVIHNCTGTMMAMKQLDKRMLSYGNQFDYVINEKMIMSMIESPFVAGLRYALQDDFSVYLFMDLMTGGDMKFQLTQFHGAGGLPHEAAVFWAAQILLGLEALHSQNIMYRDLKLENILVDKHGNAKLCDMGMAIYTKVKVKEKCGTPGYQAPEMIEHRLYGSSVDFFSYGVLLYRLLSSRKPFSHTKTLAVDHVVVSNMPEHQPKYDYTGFTPDGVDLVKKLLNKKPEHRIGSWTKARIDEEVEATAALQQPILQSTNQVETNQATTPATNHTTNEFNHQITNQVDGTTNPTNTLPGMNQSVDSNPTINYNPLTPQIVTPLNDQLLNHQVNSSPTNQRMSVHERNQSVQTMLINQSLHNVFPAPATNSQAFNPSISLPVHNQGVDQPSLVSPRRQLFPTTSAALSSNPQVRQSSSPSTTLSPGQLMHQSTDTSTSSPSSNPSNNQKSKKHQKGGPFLACRDNFALIKQHPFFKTIDWNLLEAGLIPSPVTPNPNQLNQFYQEDSHDAFLRSNFHSLPLDPMFLAKARKFEFVDNTEFEKELVDVLVRAEQLEQSTKKPGLIEKVKEKHDACCVIC